MGTVNDLCGSRTTPEKGLLGIMIVFGKQICICKPHCICKSKQHHRRCLVWLDSGSRLLGNHDNKSGSEGNKLCKHMKISYWFNTPTWQCGELVWSGVWLWFNSHYGRRRLHDRLISTLGIHILVKRCRLWNILNTTIYFARVMYCELYHGNTSIYAIKINGTMKIDLQYSAIRWFVLVGKVLETNSI